MKKFTICSLLFLALTMIPATSMALEKNPAPTPTEIPIEIKTMLNRLEEIKSMNKSELKSSDRKALRVEVRDIKKKVRASGNGLYISSGAIIIILLLIIIL